MKDLGRLLGYARPYIGRLVMAAVCSALGSVVILGLVSLVQPLVNDVLRMAPASAEAPATGKLNALDLFERALGGEDWSTRYSGWARDLVAGGGNARFLSVALLLVLLFILKGIFTYFASYNARSVGLRILLDLRKDLYTRIHGQSMAFFSVHATGLLISRITSDVSVLQRTLSTGAAEFIRISFIIIAQVLFLFYMNWRLSIVCLFVLPLIVYPILRFGRRLKTTSRRTQEKMADVTNILKETITGTRVVKGFGMESYEIGRFGGALRRVLRQQIRSARLMSATPPVMELLGALAGALLLGYAGFRISQGTLNPGVFSSFLGALVWLFLSLKNLARINNQLQQALAAARRIFAMMDTDMTIPERPGAPELAPFHSTISFRDVSFSYGDSVVLRDVNLDARAGEVVAVVGSSGAGKTTLLDLLPRFHDVTSGSVAIDGVDIREVALDSLRRQIGIVTQEVVLFDDTVRNNLAYGRKDVPHEQVEAAARAAFAHDFIERLPEGYDTMLGEAGNRLSVGERQRISIARAVLKDSPILILDEATSALDAESEAMVQRALQNLMEGRTVFVIAHRLSTVRNADLIAVLEKGRITEQGTHDSLLRAGGAYARLYRLQFHEDGVA